ncbi:MAG: S-layer domain protein, partial [Bacilli bacterium]|nr:S-layer domain protein [Bacilli bacterium]
MSNHRLQIATFVLGISLFGSLSPLAVQADSSGSTSVGSSSTAELSQQQALDQVKKWLAIDDSYKLIQVSKNEKSSTNAPFAKATWSFTWNKGDAPPNMESLNATVDATTGILLSFYRNYNGTSATAKTGDPLTADQVVAKAVNWIADLAPSKQNLLDQPVVQPYTDYRGIENGYSLRFSRLVNGVPVLSDGISITLSDHGDLLNYNFSWT